MFNLSGSEIIVILLLALVVLGPEKLPEAMRRAGRTYAELKRMGNSFQEEVRSALDEPAREMRETADLLRTTVTETTSTVTGSTSTVTGTSATPASTRRATPPVTPRPAVTPPTTPPVDGPEPEPSDEALINRTLSGDAPAAPDDHHAS